VTFRPSTFDQSGFATFQPAYTSLAGAFFCGQNAQKSIFGGAPDPAGGAYDAPPDRLVGWGGGYQG